MRNTILITLAVPVLALLLVGCSGKKDDSAASHDHQQMNNTMTHDAEMSAEMSGKQAGERFIYYTCPMPEHKHIHSKEPGQCTECGMPLVQAVVTDTAQMEFWGCPMEAHSHVRHENSGKCPECGMNLKPMRLVKN
ncbi:MAG: hypothetical protein K9N11_08950 [Lentisphaeria bacterium]|nr:hypothetical protein [Candidatus Neomarinimicrobiota bacterium]MCF7842965.1 hypothetical protein [Lentisphaeria bacterium]